MDGSLRFRTPDDVATATIEQRSGVLRLVVVGEVDAGFTDVGAAVLAELAEADRPVEVDLAGVTFFTAAGVGWLVALQRSVPSGARVVAASRWVTDVTTLCAVPLAGFARTIVPMIH